MEGERRQEEEGGEEGEEQDEEEDGCKIAGRRKEMNS